MPSQDKRYVLLSSDISNCGIENAMKAENFKIDNFNDVYALVLGREQKIALAELEAVLRRFGFCVCKNHPERGNEVDESKGIPCYSILSLHQGIAIIKVAEKTLAEFDAAELMRSLGGAISIYGLLSETKAERLPQIVANDFMSRKGKNFAIADYTGSVNVKTLNKWGIEIKINVRSVRSVRFISNKIPEHNSATLFHKISKSGGEAYGIFAGQEGVYVGRLLATVNPDEWSERDYGKPAGDKYSGMMPPKLARMMVNIALGQISNVESQMSNELSNVKKSKNLELPPAVAWDPFCGSGNILMEAALLGCDLIGSDVSDKAVADSKTNLNWLSSQDFTRGAKFEDSIFRADATEFDFAEKVPGDREVVIVTEPYLGTPKKVKAESHKLKAEVEELKNLYIRFFQNIKLVASSYQIKAICFVFPLIETNDSGTISLYGECVDELREMGYNPIRTLRYGRDYQVVKREIVLLEQDHVITKKQ